MKTIIEIHALQNFAPSNLNRDDTGAPKDAIFGGTRRGRISSQCIKRAVREHFRNVLGVDDLAYRTKRLMDALVDDLAKKGRDKDEAAQKATSALNAIGLKLKDGGKSEYLLFMGRREISRIAEIIDQQWDEVGKTPAAEGKKSGKGKKDSALGADQELRKALERVLDGGKAVDVALFGRMLADMPEKNQYAACQVAHAISTHAVEREFDFYTAVDDLKPEDNSGADMIGTVEFNSACFYRYALVDWEKLVANLQGDETLTLAGLRAFLEGFVVAEPTGKQNSFAAHNPPEFVALCVRRKSTPRSLANAFENAVRVSRGDSLTALSAQRLVDKAKILQETYGGEQAAFVLNTIGVDASGYASHCPNLERLLDEALNALKG